VSDTHKEKTAKKGERSRSTLSDGQITEALPQEGTFGQLVETPGQLINAKTKKVIPIASAKCKVGRDPSNQVILDDDPYASRFHIWITYEDGQFFVEDLGSTNGTLLNGSPLVRRRELNPGDKLRIGRTDLLFALH